MFISLVTKKRTKEITADKILILKIQRLETRFAQTFRLQPYSATIIFNNLKVTTKNL